MRSKKVIRYYSECGRGFWNKQKALTHEKNCTCWKNPKFKTCVSCKNKDMQTDDNGMENEPYLFESWEYNNCEHSEQGAPVHKDFSHIRRNCPFHKLK